MPQAISTNTFTVAKFVVSADATQGTHTTIQAAINAASSGDNIFIRGGTYTEDLTLKAGINITAAQGSERTPTVTVIGNATFTAAGTVSLSDLRLQTNGSFCLSVTGIAASIVKLNNCYINATNNTAISFTSSSASAQILIVRSICDLTTTGIAMHSSSSAGTLEYRYCNTTNTGGSSIAASNSAGTVRYFYTNLLSPISTTGSGSFQNLYSSIDTSAQNATSISVAGNGTSTTNYNAYTSGTATAVDVSGSHTLNLIRAVVSSSNVNAISVGGSGALKSGFITFLGTSSGISGAAAFTTLAGHYITGTSINISNDATASTINIGTGAASKVVTLGSTTTTSSLALKYGTADFTLASATGTVMTALDTGEITYPLKPSFYAYLAGNATNVTGDATAYTIAYDTELFDRNSDFNTGTATFTAPVTGLYWFYHNTYTFQLGVLFTILLSEVVTTARAYLTGVYNPGAMMRPANLDLTTVSGVYAQMTAGDTCTIRLTISGSTKTVDVGGTATNSFFCGYLVA